MTAFTNFQNILPDPNNTIGAAGQVEGSSSAGFASVSLTSNQPTMRDRTNSGRLIARRINYHSWDAKISYNPMTREDFDPLYTFLLQRGGPIHPFFVSLPQYRTPKSADFHTWILNGGGTVRHLEVAATTQPGTTSVLIGKSSGYTASSNGTPLPGDMFHIASSNSNHNKAYMVTRVETNADYHSALTQPSTAQVRVHFTPPLSKRIFTGDDFVFLNPLMRVIMKGDVQEYSLNTDNLFKFSLNLEEVQ